MTQSEVKSINGRELSDNYSRSQLLNKIDKSKINDDGTGKDELWSANKISSQIKEIEGQKYDDVSINGSKLSMSANGVVKKTITLPSTGEVVEDHTHNNKTTLDKITEEKLTSWDSKAEGNHNHDTAYAKKSEIPVVDVTKQYVDTELSKKSPVHEHPYLPNSLKTNYDSAYAHSQNVHAPSNAQKNSDITKAEIEAKLTGVITTHSHASSGGSWIKSVKDFGATGDGIKDDTTAIQSAMDWSNANVATVYFPKGKYKVTRTLEVGTYCSFKGDNQLIFGKEPYGPGNINDCVIQCLALIVFRGKGKTSTSTSLHECEIAFNGIAFQQGDPTNSNMLNSVFFEKLQLNRSDIRMCLFRGFGIWLLGSMFMKTYVERNAFMECRKYFIRSIDIQNIGNQAGIVDCRINNNYISGSQDGTVDNIAFSINYPAFSEVKGNFIDFWKWGFDIWQSEMFSITDNDFQYCSVGIRPGGTRGINIHNNRFGKMNYNEHKSGFRNDVSRWGNNWMGIDVEYDTQQCVITNNIGSTVDILIKAHADGYERLYIDANMSSGTIVDTIKNNDTAKKIFIQDFK